MDEFDIDGSTQRMDTTFIEANIKQLSRIDLVAKVVHTFLNELLEERLQELPAALQAFADRDSLNLSYQLRQGAVEAQLETLVDHAHWLVDRFETEEPYNDFQSFAHLQRVLDEQCYRIPALEADDEEPLETDHDDDDDDHHGWEPVRKSTSRQDVSDDDADRTDDSNTSAAEDADPDDADDDQDRVELTDPADIGSDSLQNPHDEEATYRKKNDEHHHGYKSNWAETCGEDNPFRVITDVQVDTNNTEDTEFLDDVVEKLAEETGLADLLTDGGYQGEETERTSGEAGVRQHFSGIKGRRPDPEKVSLAEAWFAGHELVACPQGYTPSVQEYTSENERYWGRMDKAICENCPHKDTCFVDEKQEFYSYGFYARELEVARHRAKLADPEKEEFLNQRAGAESMINEVSQKSGGRTKFTGKIKVKNASIATAIGRNLKRASVFLATESPAEPAVA